MGGDVTDQQNSTTEDKGSLLPLIEKLEQQVAPTKSRREGASWEVLARSLFEALEHCYAPNSVAYEKRMVALGAYNEAIRNETKK